MESKSKELAGQGLPHERRFTAKEGTISTCDTTPSRNETRAKSLRVELALEEYAVLAKRAAQEGLTVEALVAQAVGKLLQQ